MSSPHEKSRHSDRNGHWKRTRCHNSCTKSCAVPPSLLHMPTAIRQVPNRLRWGKQARPDRQRQTGGRLAEGTLLAGLMAGSVRSTESVCGYWPREVPEWPRTKARGRPPAEPFLRRLAAWSTFSGLTAVIPRPRELLPQLRRGRRLRRMARAPVMATGLGGTSPTPSTPKSSKPGGWGGAAPAVRPPQLLPGSIAPPVFEHTIDP